MKENKIKILTDREHVLKRPARYVGSIENIKTQKWVLENNKIELKEEMENKAFKKVFREILDNSIDEYIRTNGRFANKIKIKINTKTNEISLEDNGRGIPYSQHEENGETKTGAQMAWTRLKAGSNFDDEDDNTTIGQNGEGASLTNILSSSFIGETCDGKKKVTIICKENMNKIEEKVEEGKKKFTRVTYKPDLNIFKIEKIPEYFIENLKIDFLTMVQTYEKLKIEYTVDKQTDVFEYKKGSFKDFVRLFKNKNPEEVEEESEEIEAQGIKIGVLSNPTSEERIYHSINGLVVLGGNPLNWIVNKITKELKSKLEKKLKGINQGDIKQNLTFIIIMSGMQNPRFDSQTKENCINTYTQFKNTIGEDLNIEKYVQKLIKKKSILEPLMDFNKMKQSHEEKKALKDLKPELKKRVIVDKYYKTSGDYRKSKIGLVLTEGDSALQGVIDTLGREKFSFFPLKGKPLNVLEKTNTVIKSNNEIKNILQILELDITLDKPKMKYDSVIIATDADPDGAHITGLLISLFFKFTPDLVRAGKIKLFKTPMIVGTPKRGNGKKRLIYNFKELFEMEEKEDLKKKYDLHYYKGLGSWAGEDLNELIDERGIDSFIIPFKEKEKNSFDEIVENWFKEEHTNFRKEQIKKENFNIERA